MWGEDMENELDSMCGITDEELTKTTTLKIKRNIEMKKILEQ